MKVTFVVNDISRLEASSTTVHLIATAFARGWAVSLTDVRSLVAVGSEVKAFVREIATSECDAIVIQSVGAPARLASLHDSDVILNRTNPSNDDRRQLHNVWLAFAFALEDAGTLFLNSPRGLARGSSKALQVSLPASLFPETIVSTAVPTPVVSDPRIVVKPAHGTRGNGVTLANASTVEQAVEDLDGDAAVIQAYAVGADAGDIRLLMLGGEPLEVDGKVAAVARRPAPGEFRSNIHLGGTAAKAELDPRALEAARSIGPFLRRLGLFFVGLDFVGTKILELNVFSPGGLPDAERFEGAPFTQALLDAIAREVELQRGRRLSPNPARTR